MPPAACHRVARCMHVCAATAGKHSTPARSTPRTHFRMSYACMCTRRGSQVSRAHGCIPCQLNPPSASRAAAAGAPPAPAPQSPPGSPSRRCGRPGAAASAQASRLRLHSGEWPRSIRPSRPKAGQAHCLEGRRQSGARQAGWSHNFRVS